MKYRKLGAAGPAVSEIGFGAWGIGGDANGGQAYGPTDDAESVRALQRAFDLGVTFYDTSDFYGYGRSEELIGRALGRVRDRAVIATKVGMLDSAGSHDFSAAHIRRSAEVSLRRLATDYIDLYQLHNPPVELLGRDETILATLEDLQREGKIRAYGMSARSPAEGLVMAALPGVASIQVNLNMIDQRAVENGLLAACRERGVGVITRTPLCFGFLTGKYSSGQAFGDSDHRSRWSARQIERWAGAYRLFTSATRGGGSPGAVHVALRYCLSHEAVSSVIPGMLTAAQVEENVVASDMGPLAPAEMEDIAAVYRRNVFFEPPAARVTGSR